MDYVDEYLCIEVDISGIEMDLYRYKYYFSLVVRGIDCI